ncbi:MAG TPA: hypothetical protein VIL72_05685 [Beijerinckiaceae bacterium]|jgi:hypothetical protein
MSRISRVIRGLLSRFNVGEGFVRAHERRRCVCVGEIHFIDRGFATRGIIDEISCGGVRFRPVHSFVLERGGDAVIVRFNGLEIEALLVNVSPKGYGLKLRTPLSDAQVDGIVRKDEAPSARAA